MVIVLVVSAAVEGVADSSPPSARMVRLLDRGGEGVDVGVGELLVDGKLDESPEQLGAVG